jgi:two-component system sensor histidine kinase YesM
MGALIGNRIALPIISITEKIKKISEGEADFSTHLDIRSNDEIGRLAEYFNTFVEKLSNLQELDHREVELMLKDTQMNALQAQINPHFLYNTLETIRFMISAHDVRAVEMVQILADLFRISIGKGEVYVDFSREICHLELYIALQKIRYGDLFVVEMDFPEDIRALFTLKFILQPIVENCITHAFEEIEGGGRIRIQARRNEESILIQILDNGSGIPEDKLHSIQEQFLGKQKKGSVGLQNVFDRIKLHFGEQFGLDIDSNPGFGTVINIRVPVLTEIPSKPIVSSFLNSEYSVKNS